jgi:predicted nucleotidyltransferase
MEKNPLLEELRDLLRSRFANRFQGVALYGSESVGSALPQSDIDILVLLTGPVAIGNDLENAIAATYPVQLRLDRALHFLVADIRDFEAGTYSIYRAAKRQGVLLNE